MGCTVIITGEAKCVQVMSAASPGSLRDVPIGYRPRLDEPPPFGRAGTRAKYYHYLCMSEEPSNGPVGDLAAP